MKKQQKQEGTKPLSEVFEFYPVEDVTTDTCTQEILAYKSMKIT